MPNPTASARFRSPAQSTWATRVLCVCFGNRFGMRHRSSRPHLSHQISLVLCRETRPYVREQLDERSNSLFAVFTKRVSRLTSFTNPTQDNLHHHLGSGLHQFCCFRLIS